ncbi:MAG TPA: peptidoglycan-associated lipoprotein Pal [Fibrobacteria bacterium]|jgi:peptidoglycan-associated lipoprotein|nr:peptidoglycan-associated lipoprotein Pal [Fibrobacteria bacterium]
MNFKKISLALLVGGAILAGCAKKPPPPPPVEPGPPKVEAPKPAPAPVVAAPKVDTVAAHRARLQARLAEVVKPIYFAYDQSSLSDQGKATAEAIARLLQEFPEVTLRIEGHADERGTNEYNLALGERRAQAVQQYLSSYGVDAGRVSVLSYGEEKPASEGKDESAWALNRRDEFTPSY